MLQLFNTLSRKKEEFIPVAAGKVLFYHCGPTVYWTQHIGNLRGMTLGDLVRRTLEYQGFEVKHVRNYTDVGHLTSDNDTGEDKMEKGAKREGKTPDEIAKFYIDQFETDTKKLNLLEPTVKPRATQYIQDMIAIVSALIEKGYAYSTDLAVYFDITKFADYTKLSHQQMDKLMEGAGKAEVSDPRKKHAADFVLWFFTAGVHTNALQHWKSPFQSLLVKDGDGFPGWHLECSAMTKALLGNTIDIHMGGVEHIPVHHTNEIAQSEAANGVKFVNYWLHNEHLLVNDKKMAKSEGTGFALSEIIDRGYDPLVLRYFFLQSHYRSKQNFTWEALDGAKTALFTLRDLALSWKANEKFDGEVSDAGATYKTKFIEAISDDLNIPKALGVVWDLTKATIPSSEKLPLLLDFDRVLGLGLAGWKEAEIPADIQKKAALITTLRKEKKFTEADAVRKEITEAGYIVQDTTAGTIVKR
ncbi:MAG: cysteine--tRNA ligase [Microgenomates group bacterium]